MFNSITHSHVYVLDQDQALDFYVGKLGMEVTADVKLDFMRWLTVSLPGEDRHLLLEMPENPYMDAEASEQIRSLLSKGAMGLGFIVTTDDCRRTHDDLVAKGVEITQEPVERFYGVDMGIRDPFGNQIRITEPAAVMGEPPESGF